MAQTVLELTGWPRSALNSRQSSSVSLLGAGTIVLNSCMDLCGLQAITFTPNIIVEAEVSVSWSRAQEYVEVCLTSKAELVATLLLGLLPGAPISWQYLEVSSECSVHARQSWEELVIALGD